MTEVAIVLLDALWSCCYLIIFAVIFFFSLQHTCVYSFLAFIHNLRIPSATAFFFQWANIGQMRRLYSAETLFLFAGCSAMLAFFFVVFLTPHSLCNFFPHSYLFDPWLPIAPFCFSNFLRSFIVSPCGADGSFNVLLLFVFPCLSYYGVTISSFTRSLTPSAFFYASPHFRSHHFFFFLRL